MINPEIDQYGTKRWFNDKNQLHNENGPAIEWISGSIAWWVDGEPHRINGPAYEYADGTKLWYVDGEIYHYNQTYQKAAGISDEDMAMIVLKYGNVT